MKARDIMTNQVVALKPEQTVTEAAKILSEKRIGGAPVLKNGSLIGIVSESDLIIQDVKLHFPTYIQLLDSYIYLGSLTKFEATLRKAVAVKVKDIMTENVKTIGPDAPLEDVATIMADEDINILPVMEGKEVIGIITKSDIVKSLSRA
ncbi:MAG TPA: CBS domain-containing protein [Actinobacteria bacterium]|nr:CBS domain-containing protein [Actinomycetota bacterium]